MIEFSLEVEILKINKSKAMEEAKVMRKSISGFWMIILCFIGVFVAISMAQSIPLIMLMFKDFFQAGEITEELIAEITTKYTNPSGITAIIMLFLTIFTIIASIIYCKFIEKRPLSSMGITKKHCIPNYLFGLIIGFFIFSLIVLFNVLLGGMKFVGANSNILIYYIIIYFIAYGIQGASEELLCRGYLMNSIGANHSVLLAIFTSSFVFALLHIANPGINLLSFINIFLFGVFIALYYLCSNNIWGACALHSMWNFAQGIIYGINVSGAYSNDNPILLIQSEASKPLLNGGAFGAEGGIITTIVLLVGIIATFGILVYKKKVEFKTAD